MANKEFHKVVIGRAESVHFMDFDIVDVPAKVDTGAFRSALHASDIKLEKNGDLSFRILGDHPLCGRKAAYFRTKDYKKVKIANSFGHREERYEVKLRIKLGPKIFNSAFSLADRSKKNYPILLGRKMLNDRFIVDSSITNIDQKEIKKQFGVDFPNDEEDGRE